MNRTGKIARLPHNLRTSINHRLDRNHPGRKIVNWLNSLPAVKKILRELFHNKPITEQNLSEWRNGGYLEWQIRRDFFEDTRESLHDAAELEQISPLMADHAARLLSARILNAVRKWNGDLDDPSLANLKHLSGLLRVIATLRRGDHSAARLKIQQSNHDRANAPDDDETESPGERRLLEGLRRLTYGIPRDPDPDPKSPPQSTPSIQSVPSVPSVPSSAKSDLIAPNQTTFSAPDSTLSEPAPTHTHTPTLTPSEPVPPSEPASSPSSSQPADSTIHDSPLPPNPALAHSPSSPPPLSPPSPPAPPPMSAEEFNRLRHYNPDPMPEWREKILHPIPPWLTIPHDPPTPRPLKSIMPYRC
ncbi:MAG TPA: hypothetical protein VG796_27525 [Verrucomicrobiales bacterium]|nr:hypothetical protein [Verrucomicrobiales bacterium]